MMLSYSFNDLNCFLRWAMWPMGLLFIILQVSQLFQDSSLSYKVNIILVGLIILDNEEVRVIFWQQISHDFFFILSKQTFNFHRILCFLHIC